METTGTPNDPPSVDITDIGNTVYARLYGFLSDRWEEDTPPPVNENSMIDTYITKLPFAIGRAIAADEDVSDDPKQWLILNSAKVSKKHGLIYYDTLSSSYRLKCYGRNGIDCNQTHLNQDDEIELKSKSAIRIGPFYAFFLLPIKDIATLSHTLAMETSSSSSSSSSTGTGTTTGKTKSWTRLTGSYKELVDDIYNKHFSQYGYFTVLDATRLIMVEHNYDSTEADRIKDGVRRYLNKAELYESVDISIVPNHITEYFKHPKKQMTWWRRKPTPTMDMDT